VAVVIDVGLQDPVPDRQRLQHVGVVRRRHRRADPPRPARDDDRRRGGRLEAEPAQLVMPLAGMALTYFFVNTVPIAFAIALTTNQNAWRVWKTDFASSAPSYLLGAFAAAVIIKVTESSGYWLTLLLTAAPLYLTYRMYRAGRESDA